MSLILPTNSCIAQSIQVGGDTTTSEVANQICDWLVIEKSKQSLQGVLALQSIHPPTRQTFLHNLCDCFFIFYELATANIQLSCQTTFFKI